jgi:hypothetical protein
MWKDLIPDNVCRALEFANLFEDSLLKVNILIKSASGTVKLSFGLDLTGEKSEPDSMPHKGFPVTRPF